ncbi:MAG: hypothetical protein ABGZ35_21745 [Planctomycetaceae bacterium]
MQPQDRNRGGAVPLSHRAKFNPKNESPLGYKVHLHAIGTARDGAVVAVNNHGVFRSEDEGRTWKHFSTALRDDTFNPETKRLEIVRSERHRMQLWLWSIDPADWAKGQWRRECRLLMREGEFYSDADGFHPAGAVIDEKRGVQHIFVYVGHPNGPAGVFRITRTLHTPKLNAFLRGDNP